jgi:hypothetical protein
MEFSTAGEAELAMRHLDGGQIDGQIVRVSYVLVNPRRRRASPGMSRAGVRLCRTRNQLIQML